MDKFEEVLQHHKDSLTNNLIAFGEGHRLNRMHKEIDNDAVSYRYYFEAGQQSQQAKVEELQKRVEALIQKYKDEDRELKLIDEWEQSQIYGFVASELEQALKGEGQ